MYACLHASYVQKNYQRNCIYPTLGCGVIEIYAAAEMIRYNYMISIVYEGTCVGVRGCCSNQGVWHGEHH